MNPASLCDLSQSPPAFADADRIPEEPAAATSRLAAVHCDAGRRTNRRTKQRLQRRIRDLLRLGLQVLQLSDGRRQILQFLLPGDMFSCHDIRKDVSFFGQGADRGSDKWIFAPKVHEICAVDSDAQSAIANRIAECHDATELATALGQFSAEERIAYLLLHLMERLRRSVIREQRRFPLRQQHIADAVGLTPVHVSRVQPVPRTPHYGAVRGGGRSSTFRN
jgi:hypothetical protein